MKILIVDCNLPMGEQLRKIAEDTNISLPLIIDAWNERNVTQSAVMRDFIFNLLPSKESPVIEKRLSYQAQQKQLPKFLKR